MSEKANQRKSESAGKRISGKANHELRITFYVLVPLH